jgi:hypothetical protein
VNSSDLKPEQIEALQAIVARQLRFLNRLCQRFDHLGFVPTDAVVGAALRARDAMQELHVRCHYATCRHGVGKDPAG